jgi:hypothetical protein
MEKNTITIELPREVISTIASYSAFGDKYDWDVFVEACKRALDDEDS